MQTKILLAVTIVMIICSSTDAQIKKGAVLLGGSLGFSTQNNKVSATQEYTNSNVSISPAVGKAIKENLVLGFDLNFDYANESVFPNVQKTNSYGAGVFIRKYKVLGKGFYLFGQGRAGFGYSDRKEESNSLATTRTKVYAVSANFYPGVSYVVSNKIQLEAGLNNLLAIGYSHQDVNGGKYNSFSVRSSLSNPTNFTVGIRFLLN